MKRKLVKQGATTMMISLPSKWIRQNNLQKGDEIELEESSNNLIISTEAEKSKRTTEINLSSLTESSIRTSIVNAYRLGYDEIKVNFPDKRTLSIIQNVTDKNLIGFEIIKKSLTDCVIENITEPSSGQFENIFEKVWLNIEELFEIAEEILNGKKHEFEPVEKKIQQFDNFCRRVISKSRLFELSQLRWTFHVELVHGTRELYHMLRYLAKNKIKVDPDTLRLLQNCKEIFNLLKQAYEEKNISLLEKIHEKEKDAVYNKGYSALKKGKNAILQYHILSATRNSYLASSPLIGVFISKD
jgi:phosphate uptake regulator